MSTPSRRREPYRIPRPPIEWTRVGGWIIAALGTALFVATYIAANAGFAVLPFDHHHIIGQVGGFILAIGGVSVATRRR